MLPQTNTAWVIVAVSSWVSIGAMLAIAAPRNAASKPPDNLALGADRTKQLPLPMDTGKSGRASEGVDIRDATAASAAHHPRPAWVRGKPFRFVQELVVSLIVLSTAFGLFLGLLQLLRRML
jgi:hypothetical protein